MSDITVNNFKAFYEQIRPYLGAAHSGFTPIGTVISVMGTTAPLNYLACDGTVYNIADYPELAAYFNQQFGSSNFFGGNGTTTFAVPTKAGGTDDIYCIASKNIFMDAGSNYSTEEQVVGTWIDGKPIYQKTVQVNGSFVRDDWHTVYTATGLNIKKIILCYVYNANLISVPVATKFNSSSNEVQIFYEGMGTLSVDLITIQYTKTTDA